MTATPVVIVDYSPEWPAQFERERVALANAFEPSIIEIEHIGSTSVPGLGAKPIIDILLGAPTLRLIEEHIPKLEHLGYRYVPKHERELPHRRYFVRPAVHLHAVERGSAFWCEHLEFRDALRGDGALASRYLDLKRRLAVAFGSDRAGYTDAKASFIQEVLRAAHRRASGDNPVA